VSTIRFLVALLIVTQTGLAADNWPQFRGPTGDGQTGAKHLPLIWSESKNVKWQTKIHGKGWSSPVVWEEQVWLTTATEDGKQMFVVCVDRDIGNIIHDILVFENAAPEDTKRFNSFASPTPVIEEGRVYVHFGSYGTACLDTDSGTTIWSRRDLECNHWRGPGSSPIIDGDLLFVAFDGYDKQYVVALNKHHGKTAWLKDRSIDYDTNNGDLKKAFSTCTVVDYEGRRQLIAPAAVGTVSYDVATGNELWQVRHGGMNAAVRPLFSDGLVFIAPGSTKKLHAVRVDGIGDVTETSIKWTHAKSGPMRPSPVLVNGMLFTISDDGVATCLQAKTGEVIWQKRVGGNFRASPIHGAGRIYFSSMEGKTTVIEASAEYKVLAENQLGDEYQASPAEAGGAIFLRSSNTLYRIEENERNSKP